MVVKGSQIVHVGAETDDAAQLVKRGADMTGVLDLEKRLMAPSFIDARVHILFFGRPLLKLDLEDCKSLDEIRDAISRFAKEHSALPGLNFVFGAAKDNTRNCRSSRPGTTNVLHGLDRIHMMRLRTSCSSTHFDLRTVRPSLNMHECPKQATRLSP